MSTILDLRRFLTHAPADDPPGPSGGKEDEDEAGARAGGQELDGEDRPVQVKAEPGEDDGGVEPVTKRVRREADGDDEDVKPSVGAPEEDEFDALLAEDDDLFAAVDL